VRERPGREGSCRFEQPRICEGRLSGAALLPAGFDCDECGISLVHAYGTSLARETRRRRQGLPAASFSTFAWSVTGRAEGGDRKNRAGQVSGAWEGVGDTLLHVTAMGHGKTRLHIQKARWSSTSHLKTLNLAWSDGDSFEVEDKTELDHDTLAEQIITAIAETPRISWTKVEQKTRGAGKVRRRKVRPPLRHRSDNQRRQGGR
jgi:hypothetical protein